MKLRSAPLDDVFQELLYVLNHDGRWHAWIVRRSFIGGYRCLKAGMSLALRGPWRTLRQSYPDLGDEPFNLAPEELAREWEQGVQR